MDDELTYKAAGVDIEAGYEVVRRIGKHAKSTFRPEVLQGIGSFGGFFALDNAKYQQPVLVAGTDGVGTKLKIAFAMNKHDTVGIDVVAYCVNDIICQGAHPLFFLDYIGMGCMEPATVEAIVSGVAQGCRQAGCALIGGETAELPGMYAPGEYDLAGFAVGVVERAKVINGSSVKAGDKIVAIASTGLQSSGFSLVRNIVFEKKKMHVRDFVPELNCTLGEALIVPTGIYAKLMADLTAQVEVHGIANISGGGLYENIPRSVAAGLRPVVHKGRWPIPTVFTYLQKIGNVAENEMYHTFNMGVAMVVIIPANQVDKTLELIAANGEQGYVVGEIVVASGSDNSLVLKED